MSNDGKNTQKRLTLQHQLAITPKTASLLLRSGYHEYRALQHASPNLIATQFQAVPGITKAMADGYRRAARRLVWLGTQDAPQDQAKVCKDWSNKALRARGMWKDGFDDLTGVQIEELMVMAGGGGMKSEGEGKGKKEIPKVDIRVKKERKRRR